jgi:2,3-bisphosphoglycerate-dependent phosphoglycerate mutase
MPTLFLIRHGATQWAEENRFAGWGDTPLSARGHREAVFVAQSLKKSRYSFDICFTSQLTRARQTMAAIAQELSLPEHALKYDWRLNERHYGALQGEPRTAMIKKHGNAKIVEWRRTYHGQPPQLEDNDPRWEEQLQRLSEIPILQHPRSESMAQAVERVNPLWIDEIAPALKAGKNLLVVAHTSSIRGLVRHIEGLDDAQCAAFRISTAVPRQYELDDNLAPLEVRDLTHGVKAKIRYWVNRQKPGWLGGI